MAQIPAYYLTLTIDDITKQIDKVKDFAFELIRTSVDGHLKK